MTKLKTKNQDKLYDQSKS